MASRLKTSSTPPLAPKQMAQLALGAGDAQPSGVVLEDGLDGDRLGQVAQGGARAVGVDVVDRRSGRPPASLRACDMALAAPTPSLSGGDVAAVAAARRSRASRRRCGRRGPWRAPAPRAPACRRLRPGRSRRGRGRRAGWRAAGSSFRSDRARIAAKALRPMGVTAASLPPVIITSASPSRMSLKASPMALVALAQAVTTTWFGPRRPYWIDTWALAALPISLGMVKAETLSGPLSSSRWCWTSIVSQAADARAEDHAAAPGVVLREVDARVADGVDAGDQGELREAVEPLDVLGLDVAVDRPIADLAADADADSRPRRAARADRRRSRRCKDASPELVHPAAERGDGANARYDDAAFHAKPLRQRKFRCFRRPSRCGRWPGRPSGSSPPHRRGC